ncbi:MAG TPA: aminotransferase class V-fold PLP-dependent enzyme [Acidobacteriaceae bacterium]|jgi:kynureninase|nr:aminotransferase class V-fold PLP-dependent enzyme [Acidobacteriaceae bacterium]
MTPERSDELLRYRSEFPILESTTYLISNSLGAMPRDVYRAMKAYADTWATRGVRAWEERWWTLAAQVGDEIGALMNAAGGTVSTHQNVTTCQAVVASCFDFSGQRNKVVYSDMNFPSVMYFWEAHRACGARVHMVGTEDGITVPTERLLDAIDETTLLVPMSHVLFRSSALQDAKAIIEKAHRVGAHVVLDIFQSLGSVPVDVQVLDVDFACGGVLKWLCGGPGVGYLYVRPDLGKKLEPKFTGWFAHQSSMAFETGPIRYTEPPFRFMNGTSNIPALEAARPGLKILGEVGIQRIREKSKRQTTRLIELADQRGWTVNSPRNPEARGGTVSIDMPDSQEVCRELLKREILVDWRPRAGVRMSPHFYNTDQELEAAILAVEEILRDRVATTRN